MKEKIYLESLGCCKNQVDSEKMLYALKQAGYDISEDPKDSDIIIINTCCFIESAKQEAIDTIFEMIQHKKNGTCKKVIVAGCMAQKYTNELNNEIPEIDAIIGVGDISKIVDAVNTDAKIIKPEFHNHNIIDRINLSYPGTGYLKISEGCSNYCSYCVIPQIRGDNKSRDIHSILSEVEILLKENTKEIILIAQDTTNYGMDIYDKRMLGELIQQIDSMIKGDVWLRLLYMHPDHIDNELLEKLSKAKSFAPYFDIPFQSGSNNVLKQMNRKNTQDYYVNLVSNIRSVFNDAVIRTTFIAGFPGESESDFKQTLEFMNKTQIEWIGGFTYSQEEDTPAGQMDNQIKESVKKARLKKIQKLSDKITLDRMARFINTQQKILIEEQVEGEALYIGRFWGQAPEVDGLTVCDIPDAVPGEFVNLKIRNMNGKDFFAV